MLLIIFSIIEFFLTIASFSAKVFSTYFLFLILNISKKTWNIHYWSKLWDHLFFDDCLNYFNFNSVSDEICIFNNVKAIKFTFKISLE